MQKIKDIIARLQSKYFEVRYPEYKPNDGKVHVLFLSPYINGVGLYRTILPAMHLNTTETHAAIITGLHSWNHEQQFREREVQVDDRLFQWADYVVMPTVMSDIRPMLIHMLKKNLNLKFVMDVDDNVHTMHVQHPAYNQYTREMKENLVRNLSLCEFFTTTTEALADFYISKVVAEFPKSPAEVAIVPNLQSQYLLSETIPAKVQFDKIRIGMIVTQQHYVSIHPFRKILMELQQEYGDAIELINFGWDGKYKLNDSFKNLKITCLPAVPFTEYFEAIANLHLDIGLIPLKNVPAFNQYKSYQRWLEFTSISVPVISGDSSVYSSVIQDGKTGLIARTSAEWLAKIGLLVANSDIRKSIADHAKEFTSLNLSWDSGSHIDNLKSIFNPIG